MIFYKELHYFKVIKVFNFAYSAKKKYMIQNFKCC